VLDWLKRLHAPQATLEGSGSFLPDGAGPEPLPACDGDPEPLYHDYLPDAIVHRPGHRGWFAAVDGRGRIRWQYKSGDAWPGYEGWYALVLATHSTPPEYLAYLRREEIPYLVAGKERVDLRLGLQKMASLLGVSCVLSKAGGRLNGALLRAGLIDEVNLVVRPGLIGGTTAPALFTAPDLQPDEWPVRLELLSAQVQAGGRVWLRYRVLGPSAA
jgi:riboflavin biosynthesis pyrimidine reductase